MKREWSSDADDAEGARGQMSAPRKEIFGLDGEEDP